MSEGFKKRFSNRFQIGSHEFREKFDVSAGNGVLLAIVSDSDFCGQTAIASWCYRPSI